MGMKAFKYRLYPTKAQEAAFNGLFGAVRFVFNYYHTMRSNLYVKKEDLTMSIPEEYELYDEERSIYRHKEDLTLWYALQNHDLSYNFIKVNEDGSPADFSLPKEEEPPAEFMWIEDNVYAVFTEERDFVCYVERAKDESGSLLWRICQKPQKLDFSQFHLSNHFTQLKKRPSFSWLRNYPDVPLRVAIENLDTAYKNFFDRIKKGIKPYGYPRRKKRNNSFAIKFEKNSRLLDGDKVILPRYGAVKCVLSRPLEGRPTRATISKEPSGEYYISFACTEVDIEKYPSTEKQIGLSFGIKHLATTSDGVTYDNPKYLSKLDKKLRRAARKASRCQKGSNNSKKAYKAKARIEARVRHQREDSMHKLTTQLVKECDTICVSGMNVKQLMQGSKAARAIADASWGELRRQLVYKAGWRGKQVIVVDKEIPVRQICSNCGAVCPSERKNKKEKWVCPHCNTEHTRGVNTAKNILTQGLKSISES
ncbi:MAG: transposase [Clostridia bacterium]|nr:transposase [Clostridia bacterium]